MQRLTRSEENEASPVLGVSEYSDETSSRALLREFAALVLGQKVNRRFDYTYEFLRHTHTDRFEIKYSSRYFWNFYM